jgi:hypothetical protein
MNHGVWRPDENHFTVQRAGEMGVHWSPLLKSRRSFALTSSRSPLPNEPQGEQVES